MSFRAGPRNVNEQLVEYAELGYVSDVDHTTDSHCIRVSVSVVLLGTLLIAIGATIAAIQFHGGHSTVREVVGAVVAAMGMALLIAAVHHLYQMAMTTTSVKIKPGAVIPPELVRPGNWIHRKGAWARVDEIGHDHTGRISALLSSGDIVYLESSVMIAGDAFRPAHDPLSGISRR